MLGALRDQRDVIKLSPYKAYDERRDAMDMTVCLGLMIAHWPNLFRYKLPQSARSWIDVYKRQLLYIIQSPAVLCLSHQSDQWQHRRSGGAELSE